jgi:hypothetical protein
MLIWMALGLVAFGGLVFWRESRAGRQPEAIGFLFGIPGIYVCALSALENAPWLYIPGFIMLCGAYAARFWYVRRARSTAAQYSNSTDDQ